MISEEEWENLKVGDVVYDANYLAASVNEVILIKKEEELAFIDNGSCMTGTALFLTRADAIMSLVFNIKRQIDYGNRELVKLKMSLAYYMKKMEQEDVN